MDNTIIFSDLHTNIFAAKYLEKIMATAEDIWSLGDFFGRGPHIEETALFVEDYIKNNHPYWVLGNHDAYVWNLVSKAVKARYKRTTAETLDYHAEKLSELSGDLKSHFVPERALLRWVDDFFALVHSTPGDPMGITSSVVRPYHSETPLMDNLILPFLELAEKRNGQGEKMPNALLFCGHSHFPLFINYHKERGFVNYDKEIRYGKTVKIPDGITVMNPGSVGNPRIGSNTFIELDREKHQLIFHAFRLSNQCKAELVADSTDLGFPSEEKVTFNAPPDEEKIRAEEVEYHKIIDTRENAGKIPETGNEFCFRQNGLS